MSAAPEHAAACTVAPVPPPGARHAPPPARRPHSRVQHAARPPPALCAQSRPSDDPGVPRSRGVRSGGRQTLLPVHALRPPPPCVLSTDLVTTPGLPVPGGCVRGGRQTESRPRDDPGAPRPRGMRARGAPDRTAPPCRGVRTPKTLSPSRGGHDQHAHATRPALLPRRTTSRSPWRTCRPHRHSSPPSTPRTTHRHSNQRRATRAGGSARYVDGTRRLPNSPLIDTYLVPEAPQGARSARHRPRAHHRP